MASHWSLPALCSVCDTLINHSEEWPHASTFCRLLPPKAAYLLILSMCMNILSNQRVTVALFFDIWNLLSTRQLMYLDQNHQFSSFNTTGNSHRRSQEFVLGARCCICQIFPGGRLEAPKAPMGMTCGEGVSPPLGRALGRTFFSFWSQNAEFWYILTR